MAELRTQNADYIVPAGTINLPATIAASGTAYSSIIKADGYHEITLIITSSQNGSVSIQRYIDAAATIVQGSSTSVTLTAGTQAALNVLADGLPFQSLRITVANSSGSTAALSGIMLILSPTLAGGFSSVSSSSSSSGGAASFLATAQSNTVTSVKSSAGNLYGFTFQNPNASAAYMQFFDLATGSVTLGTTTPKLSYWIPAGGVYDYAATNEAKISFATAISIAATTTASGSTAPATGILSNILYK